MFYLDVFREFDQRGIRYLVVGALAMNLYGAPRMTADLDILADLEEENLSRLVEAMGDLGYQPRLPVKPEELLSSDKRKEWSRTKGLKAFTFNHPKVRYQEVDLLLESPVPFAEGDRDKTIMTVEGISIPVISVGHLISMKKKVGRKQDLADIETLERIKRLGNRGDTDA
ncbi:MAG TPA: hypothetical protein VIU33_04705 [Nitrospiria bacterium]